MSTVSSSFFRPCRRARDRRHGRKKTTTAANTATSDLSTDTALPHPEVPFIQDHPGLDSNR
ncbi:hypothetical protein OG194_00500 [Streptomyces sp. NBC_01288]|uniref:hypothetical protein n=1 Tax=Streptomyces sp. NBC_01288 TaxID=2903814 RepID=UPI002E0F94AC|nr:hypothetical protein OG194_00500 [Streptomyces sp. NBC_01288]